MKDDKTRVGSGWQLDDPTPPKDVEELAKTFAHDLAKSVYHFSGRGQYEEESPEQKAYLDGVSTAVGMMTIDIIGGVKSQGLLKPLITTHTDRRVREETRLSEHRERLELWNEAVEEGRRRERAFIVKLIDGHKVVYKKGDERFYEDAEDGDEKDHIDSCCNETLDEVLQALNQPKDHV